MASEPSSANTDGLLPSPTSFAELKLSTSLLVALESMGYDCPTPVQSAVIPAALSRHDVMAMAKTGSGKTAAFCLPIIQLLLPYANKSTSPAHHPLQALILTPTRELTSQIDEALRAYCQVTDLRTTSIVGGVDMTPQIAQLKRGVEIVVATVGRLLDHVRQKTINLENIRFLVLDECDRMLDMGFLPDLTEILKLLPEKRQNLLFSATLTPDIRKLANTYLRHALEINISEDIEVSDTVRHEVMLCRDSEKFNALGEILHHRATLQAIVFVNTKKQTRSLARALVDQAIVAEALHGDMSQFERDAVLLRFREKHLRVLVATDVAARGLDVPALPLVINYSPPHASVEYVHRVGRTGRAGLSGEAITLCAPEETLYLADIEKLLGQKIPPFPRIHPRTNPPSPSHPSRPIQRDQAIRYAPANDPPRAKAVIKKPRDAKQALPALLR